MTKPNNEIVLLGPPAEPETIESLRAQVVALTKQRDAFDPVHRGYVQAERIMLKERVQCEHCPHATCFHTTVSGICTVCQREGTPGPCSMPSAPRNSLTEAARVEPISSPEMPRPTDDAPSGAAADLATLMGKALAYEPQTPLQREEHDRVLNRIGATAREIQRVEMKRKQADALVPLRSIESRLDGLRRQLGIREGDSR